MSDPIQFTEASPRFALPFLFAAQSQKEFFVNEALARTDILLHPAIQAEIPVPPANPADGHCWLVADGGTGEWTGRDGLIAGYSSGSWIFAIPTTGMRIYDLSKGQYRLFRDGWIGPDAPAQPTGGTAPDTELRAAFADLIEALTNAGIFPVT
ncbi:DUF2793 domain-containing protein [Altererythrobacter luteolus]|uniref:DUF2793 domain-containing protein n=1 Tax=Pontixanthobacter luteolus TaxID=295089 RepID=A0A6I4V2C6_9SPHN|nr:DUF2793 domain-containing protein [Pontixanthobacter luteolus]MXP48063.1 DUF2793 domain-containing protein [Pontixanthobacter luteolus]